MSARRTFQASGVTSDRASILTATLINVRTDSKPEMEGRTPGGLMKGQDWHRGPPRQVQRL